MITITPYDVREFGDLPKEEYISNDKVETHIKVANNDFLTIFDGDIDTDTLELDDDKKKRINDSIKELKIRLALISIIPFVNTMYVDGYAKYTEENVLTNRFYSPQEVNNLIKINSTKKTDLVTNIQNIITGPVTDIVKDKSGLSFTAIGGEFSDD